MKKPSIMLVNAPSSDSQHDFDISPASLHIKFEVTYAATAEQAISHINAHGCEGLVVLIFNHMPSVCGYTICRQLLDNTNDLGIDIIFADVDSKLENKRKAYESGASDYITLPVQTQELAAKVALATKRNEERAALEKQAQEAMDTAMASIMDAGEQACVLHFMRDSFSCVNEDALAILIVESCEYFELNSTVQIRLNERTINHTNGAQISSLEMSVLHAVSTSSIRIYQQGRRLMLNYGVISLLIKNLPIEDDAKCGRIRDNIALIIEGACSRLTGLIARSDKKQLISQTKEAVASIHAAQGSYKQKSLAIMDDLLEDIRISFLNYGLTEEQENTMLSIIERHSERMVSAYEKGVILDDKLEKVTLNLSDSLQGAV